MFQSPCSFLHIAIHVQLGGYVKTIRVIVLFHSFTPYQINATPLYMACENGHQDVVQWLLGVVADVEIARSNVSF